MSGVDGSGDGGSRGRGVSGWGRAELCTCPDALLVVSAVILEDHATFPCPFLRETLQQHDGAGTHAGLRVGFLHQERFSLIAQEWLEQRGVSAEHLIAYRRG